MELCHYTLQQNVCVMKNVPAFKILICSSTLYHSSPPACSSLRFLCLLHFGVPDLIFGSAHIFGLDVYPEIQRPLYFLCRTIQLSVYNNLCIYIFLMSGYILNLFKKTHKASTATLRKINVFHSDSSIQQWDKLDLYPLKSGKSISVQVALFSWSMLVVAQINQQEI